MSLVSTGPWWKLKTYNIQHIVHFKASNLRTKNNKSVERRLPNYYRARQIYYCVRKTKTVTEDPCLLGKCMFNSISVYERAQMSYAFLNGLFDSSQMLVVVWWSTCAPINLTDTLVYLFQLSPLEYQILSFYSPLATLATCLFVYLRSIWSQQY